MRHTRLIALGVAAVALTAAPVAVSAESTLAQQADQATAAKKKAAKKRVVRPVKTMSVPGFGRVLSTRRNQALYWWERDVRGKVVCTGACARAWPPLIIPKKAKVPRKIRGVRGRFGSKLRPDGRRQVTYNGYPIYTYAHEGRNIVLCDNVDQWFVARARGLR